MPKSSKHKAARKADFARAKLKLGKGKQIASNSTNTSFSSKSIGLPSQSITQQKAGPTTSKNHTLDDLLVQSKHYSTSVKKNALLELQQLLINYPFLLLKHLLPLFSALSHLISDPALSIRNLSLNLLRFVFDTLSLESLIGTSGGLILFTVSSLSSLDEGIRLSALKMLDLLMEKIPREIVAGWEDSLQGLDSIGLNGDVGGGTGSQVIEALLGVFRVRKSATKVGQGTFTSASSSDLSPSTRSATLSTLSTFLRIALSPTPSATSMLPWYLANSFSTVRDYHTFVSSFLSPSMSIVVNTTPTESVESFSINSIDSGDLALSDLSLPLAFRSFTSSETPSVSTTLTSQPSSLLTLLSPTLLSSFLDSAPSAFPTSVTTLYIETGHHLETVCAVMNIAKDLYGKMLYIGTTSLDDEISAGKEDDNYRKSLLLFLTHASVYFPFDSKVAMVKDSVTTQKLLQLNVSFSSLVSLLVSKPSKLSPRLSNIRMYASATSSMRQRSLNALASKAEHMILNVCDWIIPALRNEIISISHPLGIKLSVEAFESLEPTLWALMNKNSHQLSDESKESQVFAAVFDYFNQASSGSESKKSCFVFIVRVILIQEHAGYINHFKIESTSNMRINDWISTLPKYLWELGDKSHGVTKLIIRFLVKQVSNGSLSDQVICKLRQYLVPFFQLQHPTRGSILGPFIQLPLEVQANSLDLVLLLDQVVTIEGRSEVLVNAAGVATKALGGELSERWKRIPC